MPRRTKKPRPVCSSFASESSSAPKVGKGNVDLEMLPRGLFKPVEEVVIHDMKRRWDVALALEVVEGIVELLEVVRVHLVDPFILMLPVAALPN